MVEREYCLRPNPEMIFRKEENGAFLFDPHTGNLKYLNANGVNIFELCDGRKTVGEIVTLLIECYPDMAADKIVEDTGLFFENLTVMKFLTICECNGS